MTEYLKATQLCGKCGKEYEANHVRIFSSDIDFSGGCCLDCRAKQRKELDEHDQAEASLALASKRRKWRESCGIPKRFMGQDFSTYNLTWTKERNNFNDLLSLCRKYADEIPLGPKGFRSLAICSPGTQGVGKTHLASAIGHKLLDRWQGVPYTCPVAMVSEAELYNKIQNTYSYSQDERSKLPSEQDIINRYINIPLLILDDLGTETRNKKDFSNRILFALVNGRYDNEKPIVVTTNLSTGELNSYLSDESGRVRIMDRLIEMAGGEFFQVHGPSYRRR